MSRATSRSLSGIQSQSRAVEQGPPLQQSAWVFAASGAWLGDGEPVTAAGCVQPTSDGRYTVVARFDSGDDGIAGVPRH